MEYQEELRQLRTQLNLSNDNVSFILRNSCNSFVKKFQSKGDIDHRLFDTELKNVRRQIDLYIEYTDETISKYGNMKKLRNLFQAVTQSQAKLLNITSAYMSDYSKRSEYQENQVRQLTEKVYNKCATCQGVTYRARLEHVRDEVQLRFKNAYNYFMHDVDEINRLEEQAMLILRKKNLSMQEMSEEEYIGKLQKMGEHMGNTIEHVGQSLISINSFQSKLEELQENQDISDKMGRGNQKPFNPKLFTMKLGKHFAQQIKRLEDKLNSIKKYIVNTVEYGAQTKQSGGYISMETINKLKEEIVKGEVQNKQLNIYKTSLEQRLNQSKARTKYFEDNKNALEKQREELTKKIKDLEFQLEKSRYRQRDSMASISKFQSNDGEEQIKKKNKRSVLQPNLEEIKKSLFQCSNEQNQAEHNDEEEIDTVKELKESQVFKELSSKKNTSESHIRKKSALLRISRDLSKTQKRSGSLIGQPRFNPHAKIKQKAEDSQNSVSIEHNVESLSNELDSTPEMNAIAGSDLDKANKSKGFTINEIVNVQIDNLGKMKQFKNQKGSKTKRNQNIDKETELEKQDQVMLLLYERYTERKKSNKDNNKENIEENIMSFDIFKDKIKEFLQHEGQQKDFNYTNNDVLKKTSKMVAAKDNRFSSFGKTVLNNYSHKKSLEPLHPNAQNPAQLNHRITKHRKFPTELSQIAYSTTRNNRLGIPMQFFNHRNSTQDQSKNSCLIVSSASENKKEIPFVKLQKLALGGSNFHNSELALTNAHRFSQILQSNQYLANKNQKLLKRNAFPNGKFDFNLTFGEELGSMCLQKQFCQKDVKIIFHSLENAFELGKSIQGRGSSQNQLLRLQESLSSTERGFINEFFASMATIHLSNLEGYQQIKLFLISPYDSVISQINELKVLNTGSHSSLMKESLTKILVIHRKCTVKNQVCKHLKYFLKKIKSYVDAA